MVTSGFMPLVSGVSALPVLTTLSASPSATSQAQPLPNWEVAALVSSSRQAATLPKLASIFALSAAGGSPPPFGLRLCQ